MNPFAYGDGPPQRILSRYLTAGMLRKSSSRAVWLATRLKLGRVLSRWSSSTEVVNTMHPLPGPVSFIAVPWRSYLAKPNIFCKVTQYNTGMTATAFLPALGHSCHRGLINFATALRLVRPGVIAHRVRLIGSVWLTMGTPIPARLRDKLVIPPMP